MANTTRWRRARAWAVAMAACLLLAACGGGDSGGGAGAGGADRGAGQVLTLAPATLLSPSPQAPTTLPGTSNPSADLSPPTPVQDRTLVPGPPEPIDATREGERRIKAVAGLDDGGHVLVWMARDTGDASVPWTAWLQRLDAQGRKRGEPVPLAYPDGLARPEDVAVTVLPEGRIGLSVLTDRIEDVAFAITELRYWPFNLQGAVDGPVRLLDAERYARFSPRFARLAGPVTAAAGRDGSQFVAWHYQVVGAAPLAPSVRAIRLAADGEPLGWIQRLDGDGSFSRVFDVRITPIDEGGWVVELERASLTGARVRNFVQLDVPRPLAFQQEIHPAGAFLLDLRGHGSVLLSRQMDPGSGEAGDPFSLHFTRRGQAQAPRPLASLPVAAVALAGGDYLTFDEVAGGLVARRYTPSGESVGPPIATAATPGLLAAGLRRGGVALGWVATGPDGQVLVLSQRLSPAGP